MGDSIITMLFWKIKQYFAISFKTIQYYLASRHSTKQLSSKKILTAKYNFFSPIFHSMNNHGKDRVLTRGHGIASFQRVDFATRLLDGVYSRVCVSHTVDQRVAVDGHVRVARQLAAVLRVVALVTSSTEEAASSRAGATTRALELRAVRLQRLRAAALQSQLLLQSTDTDTDTRTAQSQLLLQSTDTDTRTAQSQLLQSTDTRTAQSQLLLQSTDTVTHTAQSQLLIQSTDTDTHSSEPTPPPVYRHRHTYSSEPTPPPVYRHRHTYSSEPTPHPVYRHRHTIESNPSLYEQ